MTAGASARRGVLVVVAAITLFACVDVLSKMLGQRMPVAIVIWARFVLFVPIALALAWRPGRGIVWRSGQPWLQVLRSVMLPLQMGLFISAFAALPLADVHAVGSAAPLLVTALSVPLLGEHVDWRRWCAVLAGFAGVLLIVRPGFAEVTLPILYVVGGTSLWACYQIVLKVVGRTDNAVTSGVWSAVIGSVVTSVAAWFAWTPPDASGWGLLAAAALVGGLGHIVYSRAFNLAPASTLQPFNYLLLVYGAFFGWLVFGDVPDPRTIAGATIVVCAGLYTFRRAQA